MPTLTVDRRELQVTNLDKIFWPDDGYTKADVMNYYVRVWPVLAPHLLNRPLSLVRYPDGIEGEFFYQKDCPNAPEFVETVEIPSEDRVIRYAMANNLPTLLWAVNLGAVEVHPWLSTREDLDRPTYVIFDLDPMAPATYQDGVRVALAIKRLCDGLGLRIYPKVSGATGLHLYLPVKRRYGFKETSTFVRRLGEAVIAALPELATNERRVQDRAGKVYIDHLQNIRGKTIASVYSIRPFSGAPVSLPVAWDELPATHPAVFTLANAIDRVERTGDLFRPLLFEEQELPAELLR
ncbi:MAG: non-homologous end-joining DNA ligase [Patescibacteria group bacterium]